MGEKVKRDLSQLLWAKVKAMSSILHQLWQHREGLEAAQHLDVMNSSPVFFQRVLAKWFGWEKRERNQRLQLISMLVFPW